MHYLDSSFPKARLKAKREAGGNSCRVRTGASAHPQESLPATNASRGGPSGSHHRALGDQGPMMCGCSLGTSPSTALPNSSG